LKTSLRFGVKISCLKWFQIMLAGEEPGALADESRSAEKMGSPDNGLPNKMH